MRLSPIFKFVKIFEHIHCAKIVHIWSFSGPYFPTYGQNTGKHGPEKLWIRTFFTQLYKNLVENGVLDFNSFYKKSIH